MSKYAISFNGEVLYSKLSIHKKSGLIKPSKYVYNSGAYKSTLLLFDTVVQAQLFLLSRSSFPKFKEYIIPENPEQLLAKLINKGKYTSKLYFWGQEFTAPYLCEFVIMEYQENE